VPSLPSVPCIPQEGTLVRPGRAAGTWLVTWDTASGLDPAVEYRVGGDGADFDLRYAPGFDVESSVREVGGAGEPSASLLRARGLTQPPAPLRPVAWCVAWCARAG
jgi:hypothetical protein